MAMHENNPDKRGPDKTSAVSEVIGAVMLITVVVACVSLVAVFLFSQQTPGMVPNLNFMAGTNNAQTILYLYHNGGDTLKAGEFSVLVDGVPAPYSISGGGSQWSLGKNLIIPITTLPKNVMIVYNGTGTGGTSGALLLRTGSVNITKTVNITADTAPYLDCSAVKNWACADQIPREIITAEYSKTATESAINFLRTSSTSLDQAGKTLVFKVMDNNATFTIELPGGPQLIKMSTGDILEIKQRANSKSLRAFALGSKFWEINAAGVDLKDTFAVNGSSITWSNSNLLHAYVPVFEDLGSSMTVLTASSSYTFLAVNNTIYIDGTNSQNIVISNIQPLGLGLFILEYNDSDHSVYFVGHADTITIGGVPQNYP